MHNIFFACFFRKYPDMWNFCLAESEKEFKGAISDNITRLKFHILGYFLKKHAKKILCITLKRGLLMNYEKIDMDLIKIGLCLVYAKVL